MKLRKSIKPNFNYCIFLIAFIIFSNILHSQQNTHKTYLKILGTVQDGGAPHIACKKKCCKNLSPQEKANRKITCLEVFQPESKQSILGTYAARHQSPPPAPPPQTPLFAASSHSDHLPFGWGRVRPLPPSPAAACGPPS